jgi:hypothetical protein
VTEKYFVLTLAMEVGRTLFERTSCSWEKIKKSFAFKYTFLFRKARNNLFLLSKKGQEDADHMKERYDMLSYNRI